jgi:hypothetical protein
MPQTENEWLQVTTEYDRNLTFLIPLEQWTVHTALQAPVTISTTSHFLSNVLLALVDVDYCFMYADVGCQGRVSDGGVFRNTGT